MRKQAQKISRNDPCPCGSGKKYKKCCAEKVGSEAADAAHAIEREEEEKQKRELKITQVVQKAYDLFMSKKYGEALQLASDLLTEHPHEDRLHDLKQLNLLYLERHSEAQKICRSCWLAAVKDKDFIRTHGYQPRERDKKAPASPGFPPTAWLAKYWIAKRAGEYKKLGPQTADPQLMKLIQDLRTADDLKKFPTTKEEGIQIRRVELAGTITELQARGAPAIPYLLPYTYRYSWTCLLIPDILAALEDELAIEILMDITMFQIAYASESSMRYLEQKGPEIVRNIKRAFALNKEFDPIKTGLISVAARIKTKESFNLLLSLLDHPEAHVVNWAGGALAQFGDTAALPKMKAARNRIGSEPKLDWGIEQLQQKKQIL